MAFSYPLTSDDLIEVFKSCPLLETVDLRFVRAATDNTLSVLAAYCSHLKHLHVKGCPVSNEVLQMLKRQGVVIDIEVKEKSMHRILGQI